MKVIRDDIWLCEDCMIFACNGDLSGIDADARAAEIERCVAALGPHLVPDFDSESGDGYLEFSWQGCDCCEENAHKGGSLHRFAVLGDDDPDDPE